LKITLNICRIILASAASVGCGLAFANQHGPSDAMLMTSDAESAAQAASQLSAQDEAKGFIGGSHLNLTVRSYFDHLQQEGAQQSATYG
jgi:hypothetical protein